MAERPPVKREVAGSTPAVPASRAGVGAVAAACTETRKVGVLIRFEPGDVLMDVGVRSPQSPPPHYGERSLTAKPQVVILVDIGSSPFVHPTGRLKGIRHTCLFQKQVGERRLEAGQQLR